MARKPISKKARFEVFKRDSFKCQYCGKSAPDVILNVDHIKPVADGGTNHMTNLITACFDCNQGKKDRLLDDNSILEKQRQQLEELNERRLQLEMMMEWRQGLASLEDNKVQAVANRWFQLTDKHYSINEKGMKDLRKWLRTFELNLILDCMDISFNQYAISDSKNGYTRDSIEKVFSYIPKIAKNKVKEAEKPYLKDLYYMRGILKNRLNYFDAPKAIYFLERAHLNGASLEWLMGLVKEAPHWTYFRNSCEQYWEGEDE